MDTKITIYISLNGFEETQKINLNIAIIYVIQAIKIIHIIINYQNICNFLSYINSKYYYLKENGYHKKNIIKIYMI